MRVVLLAQLIKQQRERAGLTQAEVAKRAGLRHVTHLAMIEAGVRKRLAPEVLWGLSRALKIDAETILKIASQKS